MFDDVFSLSYMMRYLFAALAVVIVWLIARKSVDSIRGDWCIELSQYLDFG
jgi:hypothetical protein